LNGQDREGGVTVLAPPGVALPTSPEHADPYSFTGWRIARWHPRLGTPIWLELMRPDEHEVLPLQEALLRIPPEQARWVFDRCRRLAASAAGYVSPDADGLLPHDVEEAQHDFDALLAELDAAFPREAWNQYRPAMPGHVLIPDRLPEDLSTSRPPLRPTGRVTLEGGGL
jgi:hypothetical protein